MPTRDENQEELLAGGDESTHRDTSGLRLVSDQDAIRRIQTQPRRYHAYFDSKPSERFL